MGRYQEKQPAFSEDFDDGLGSSKRPVSYGINRVTSGGTQASKDKIEFVHLEDVQENKAPLSKRQKLKRHWRRFWPCYLLGAVVFLAIALPLFFLKVIPALAQLLIDSTDLPIYSATLQALSNDAVRIGLSTGLSVPAGISVTLDPIELYLYNKDSPEFQPWSMVPMDETKVSGKTDIEVGPLDVGVGNRTELNTWLRQMLYQEKAEISVRGNSTAHLGALSFGVQLKKTVQINALQELRGFAIENARILLPAREDGSNVIGNLTLPNWSDMEIGLGNLTFNVMAEDLVIGTATAWDVLLPPGNSTNEFHGELFLDVIMPNILSIVSSQGQGLLEGMLTVGISGNSTMVNGEHITYLENVLNPAYIVSKLPIGDLLGDVLASVESGSLDLGEIIDVVGDGLGDLVDGIFDDAGGGGEGEGDGGESDGNVWDDILDNWDLGNDSTRRKFARAIERSRTR